MDSRTTASITLAPLVHAIYVPPMADTPVDEPPEAQGLRDSSPTAPDPQHLQRLTPVMIRERTAKVTADLGLMPPNRRVVEAAESVLHFYLGEDWMRTKVYAKTPDGFLRPDAGEQDQSRGAYRVVELAEMLLNMQQVDGIRTRIVDLQKESLEGGVAELQGAAILHSSGIRIRFKEETKGVELDAKQGGNFDLIAEISGLNVNCEMKSKCQDSKPTGLRRRLKRARGQLPEGAPNLVFIRIPGSWMQSTQGRKDVSNAVNAYLRSSQRVTSVVVHWESWTQFKVGTLRRPHFEQYPNPRCDPAHAPVQLVMQDVIDRGGGHWWSLRQVVWDETELRESQEIANQHAAALDQAEALRSRKPMPFDMAYSGSIERLRSIPEERLITLVNFSCVDFELLSRANVEAAEFVLPYGPVRSLVAMAYEHHDHCYQLQLEGRVYDARLQPLPDGGVAPSGLASHENPQAGDLFIQAIGGLFQGLRADGDLERAQHKLERMVIWYLLKENNDHVFSVAYGRPVIV